MAVAGAIRSSAAVGLRQTAWRAGERTQWQQLRCVSGIDRATKSRVRREGSTRTIETREKQTMEAGGGREQWEVVLPSTWVRPPLGRFPRSPKYLYAYLFSKGRDFLGRLGLRWSSKPSAFKAARYKFETGKIVPMAKAMHAAMYEALAKGDKATIRKTCGEALAGRFVATIDSRPAGRRYGWELVRYNRTIWGYPRITDNKLMPMQNQPGMKMGGSTALRQVTVTIASRQRRVEYDDSKQGHGAVVPGSEREADVVENVVFNQAIDMNTWRPRTEWKILSLVGEMTPEKWKEEKEMQDDLERAYSESTRRKIGL